MVILHRGWSDVRWIDQNDWLKTFVAVADHGSFVRASAAIHRSQSRVSAHIAALEQALGATLFDRRHRPVQLTDAGEALLPFAREILATVEQAVTEVDSLSGVRRGRVALGAHPSISAGFLPHVLSGLVADYPQVQVELSEHTTVGLGESLGNGSLHLAVRSVSSAPPTESLTNEVLWREPYCAVVPAGHPLTTHTPPLTPQALVDKPLILIGRPGQGVDPDTQAVVQRWGLPGLHPSWQTEQPQTLANLVKVGLGVGVINAFAMEVVDASGLAVIQVGEIADGRVVGLSYDPDRYMSSASQAVRHAILSAPRPASTYPPT